MENTFWGELEYPKIGYLKTVPFLIAARKKNVVWGGGEGSKDNNEILAWLNAAVA